MAKLKTPMTPAIRLLKQRKVVFTSHLYDYEDKGGTAVSARELGIDEHQVIKTLIMEDESRTPLVILMHGDKEVSTKQLARIVGCKSVLPCPPDRADKNSGYQVGGTSPFATRQQMPVYMEKTILQLDRIYLNGGKRGFLVGLSPQVVVEVLHPTLVQVAI
jgi:Cys-tRNA(Pro) deacylase